MKPGSVVYHLADNVLLYVVTRSVARWILFKWLPSRRIDRRR